MRRGVRAATAGGALQENLLVGCWDVHVQPLLGDGLKPLATRRIANRRLQPNPVRLERVAPLLKLPDGPLLPHAVNPACYDARRHQDETNEHERDERPPTRRYATFRHALNRALRDAWILAHFGLGRRSPRDV